MGEIDDAVLSLAKARAEEARLKKLHQASYGRWLEENGDLIRAYGEAQSLSKLREEELRQLALKNYTETGELRPHESVVIRRNMVVEYEDSDVCDWAIETDTMRVVDMKVKYRSLEQLVREGGVPEEVARLVNAPAVAIDTKLGTILIKAGMTE